MLRVKYGWEGEGKFWALNNLIGDSEECKLDLSRKFIVADILELFQMNREQFDEFINYLVDDCELLDRNGDLISTEIVLENLATTNIKRLKNQESYKKRKEKSDSTVENEIQPTENENSATENIQSKRNETEVNESKLKEIKLEEINSSVYFQKCIQLFQDYTNIKDPNHEKLLWPIINLYHTIPENLTQKDVEDCVEDSFKALDKSKGINITYLVENISRAISKKHETVLEGEKNKVKKAAKIHRNDAKKEENDRITQENIERFNLFKTFYEKNQGEFKEMERVKILHYLKKNDLFRLEEIILPKMEAMELG